MKMSRKRHSSSPLDQGNRWWRSNGGKRENWEREREGERKRERGRERVGEKEREKRMLMQWKNWIEVNDGKDGAHRVRRSLTRISSLWDNTSRLSLPLSRSFSLSFSFLLYLISFCCSVFQLRNHNNNRKPIAQMIEIEKNSHRHLYRSSTNKNSRSLQERATLNTLSPLSNQQFKQISIEAF